MLSTGRSRPRTSSSTRKSSPYLRSVLLRTYQTPPRWYKPGYFANSSPSIAAQYSVTGDAEKLFQDRDLGQFNASRERW